MIFKHVRHNIPLLERITESGYRTYLTPDGNKYPSVTTVIKDHNKKGLDEWRNAIGESKANIISRNATIRGDSVHEALESYVNNYPITDFTVGMMPNVKLLFINIKNELEQHLTEVHGIEQPLYSNKLRLAGTADCIGVYNGLLSIIDFKTSKKLKKKEYIEGYLMQLVAYAFMFQELTGLEIQQGVVLIGVDDKTKAQVFKIDRKEFGIHLKKLVYWRDKYESDVCKH